MSSLPAPSARRWIGLTDLASEGRFVWIDGIAANSRNIDWKPGEPNASGDEDCVEINGNDESDANDEACKDRKFAICEKPLISE